MTTHYKESTRLKAHKGDMRGLYIILGIVVSVVFLVIGAIVSNAMPLPESYGDNQCELIAKDYQREYGGSLVWIQPLKENGAYDLGDYNAHIINKVYSPTFEGIGIVYYIDYKSNHRMYSKEDINLWYEHEYNRKITVFDLATERPEFSMIWHY